MISLLDVQSQHDFLTLCDTDIAVGPDMRTRLAVYGMQSPFCDFWLVRDANRLPVAAICREDGLVLLAANRKVNFDELRGFFNAIDFHTLRACSSCCAGLDPGYPLTPAPVMRYAGGLTGAGHAGIAEPVPLRDAYHLINRVFSRTGRAEQDRWYTYTSHLLRHRLAMVAGIYSSGQLVSTGGIYMYSPRYASIACVATDPAFRGQGFAGRILRYLCDRALRSGHTPVLLCAEHSLCAYYAPFGFSTCGSWAEISSKV